MHAWLLRTLVVLFMAVAGTVPALCDPVDDALALFAHDRYPDTAKGIAALGSTGHKTALQILQALGDRRLVFDPHTKKLYFRDKAQTLYDAKTGEPVKVVDAKSLKTVRVNNSLRRSIDATVGDLSIASPDAVERRAAADALFHARNHDDLPKIETALEREADPSVRRRFEQARAAIVAGKSDATDQQKRDAVRVLAEQGDQDALGPLERIAASSAGETKAAARAAISSIQLKLKLWNYGQNVWYGFSLGSVLLLAAIGLAITFGVMGVINMAHGEMVMLGAYTTFVVQDAIRNSAPSLFGWSLAISIPLAFLVAGFAGVLIERFIIRYLYGRPLETLLATWGVSLILQQAVRTVFGPNNRQVGAPDWMAGSFHLGGLDITYGRMWIIVFTIGVFVALQLVLRATSFGLRMRAVTQNRRMASAMGINTGRIDALAFGLGSGIAGIAGVALSQIDNVSPNLGQSYIIDSFLVVVFGGVGNLWGTLVAALSLGVANKFLEPVVGAVLGKILLLVFVILFIQKRPRGLFALKGRAVESG